MIGTDRNTRSAKGAPIRKEHYLGRSLLALGIMTPHAPERTTFKEHGGPNSRPVVDRVFLYVKYGSCHPATAP